MQKNSFQDFNFYGLSFPKLGEIEAFDKDSF